MEHLTLLLKWRMDRVNTPNALEALEVAVGELHAKMFANYTRWVHHVNLQRPAVAADDSSMDGASRRGNPGAKGASMSAKAASKSCRRSMASFGGGGANERTLSLATLTGDAWDFCGMWGFESGDEERKWVANAQMHQLMLWYLIWGEAANLRHMPECLCLVLYTMSNALQLSGNSAWEVATMFGEAEGPYGAYSPSGGPEDFLHSIVTPLYRFLEHEVMKRAADPVANRVMYDDVNETFWSVDGVHALLGTGYAHEPTRHHSRIEKRPRQAYTELRKVLLQAKAHAGGPAVAMRRYFKKTYMEIPSWLAVYMSFYRVYLLHAIMLHVTFAIAFYGVNWSAISTWCITHACLKALRQAVYMYHVWDIKKPPPSILPQEFHSATERRGGLGAGGRW